MIGGIKMSARARKSDYLIATAIILLYSFIGHFFNIEILKIMSIRSDGFSVSIVGVFICIITIILLSYTIRKLRY